MKIVKLTAEDILRLKAVEIVPDPNASTVVVSGKNGAGKSSVLNAIVLALKYAEATRALPQPVRKGQKKGVVTIDLGDIIVTQKITAKNHTLEVTNAEGFLYPSPQAMLDKLIGSLSFDPLAFANAKPKDQLGMLMAALSIDLETFERKRKGWYDERTAINRDVKTLTAQLEGLPTPPADTPKELVSAADIMAELNQNLGKRDQQREWRQRADTAAGTVRNLDDRVQQLQREISECEARSTAAALDRDAAMKEAASIVFADPSVFEGQLADIEATNDNVRIMQRRVEVAAAIDTAQMKSEALTQKLSELETEKEWAITAAGLPVEGLGFTDQGVTMNDVPFEQASSAEQLRVSLAIAMAMNPDLRVIRVTDGSLLDADSMHIIEEMASAEDFQVWVEVVSDQPLGVHIEEGEVVSVTPTVSAPPLTIEAPESANEAEQENLLSMFGEDE